MNSNKITTSGPSILGIITLNEKGQVVIPVEARNAMGLKVGDKLIVMGHANHGGLTLIKPDGLEKYANNVLEQLDAVRKDDKINE